MTAPVSSPSNHAIATGILRAYDAGDHVRPADIPAPASVADAMAVQALVLARRNRTVAGWKVAIGPEGRPIAAPLIDIHPDGSDIVLFPGCRIEVELAVRLARDLPPREGYLYQRGDLIEAIDHAVLGVEIIGGRFDSRVDVPFLSFLADNLGNSGYVAAQPLPPSALSMLDGRHCRVSAAGTILYDAPAVHPAGDPLAPLLAYANAQNDRLGGLLAGQVVTTGSLCGVLPVTSAGPLTAELNGIGRLAFRFVDQPAS